MATLFVPQRPKIGALEFDVSIDEAHSSSVTVTRNPVEQGAKITDNAVEEPDTLELTLRISNTPIVSADQAGAISPFRAEEAYTELLAMKSARQPVKAITSLRVYNSMIIVGVRVQRDVTTGNVLAVRVSLIEIRTATSLTIAAPVAREPRGGKKKAAGKKPTKPATPAVAEKSSTLGLDFGRLVSDNVKALTQ